MKRFGDVFVALGLWACLAAIIYFNSVPLRTTAPFIGVHEYDVAQTDQDQFGDTIRWVASSDEYIPCEGPPKRGRWRLSERANGRMIYREERRSADGECVHHVIEWWK